MNILLFRSARAFFHAVACFLLFSDGQTLAGTIDGESAFSNGFVETDLQSDLGTTRKLRVGRAVPVAASRLKFEACDH